MSSTKATSIRMSLGLSSQIKTLAAHYERTENEQMVWMLKQQVTLEMKKVYVYSDPEGDREDFEALIEGMVTRGEITRQQGESGTGLESIKDEFRPIAEAELTRQGK